MKKLTLLLLSTVLIGHVGCKKDEKKGCMDPMSFNYDPEAGKEDGSCDYAGKGGATELVFFPSHNTEAIISTVDYPDTAFIKFNTNTFPGSNPALYDLVLSGDPGEDHIHAQNMKRGNYYVFMTGWNYTINKRVRGGVPITVIQADGIVHFDVPVAD